jgi:hypothetical protein
LPRVAFRIAGRDTPFWANPNRNAYRFNRRDQDATQYLALHPLGPWAEYLRGSERRTSALLGDLRARMWVVRIPDELEELVVGFDEARTFGLEPDDLVSDDHARCQAFADELRAEPTAPRLLRVPSAALPGAENLVILGPRVAIPWSVDSLDESELSASVSADDARPPSALLPLVRFRGEPHAGLDAWLAGEPLVPIDVPVPLDD